MGYCYNLLGNIYADFKDQKTAIRYYHSAIQIAQKSADERAIIITQSNLTLAYIESNQLDSASYYATKAHRAAIRLNYKLIIPSTFRNLGRLQAILGNYRSALAYYQQSLNANTGTRSNEYTAYINEYRAYIYNLRGAVYQKMNQTDSCIFYAKQALVYAKNIQKKKRNIESYTLLVEAYKTKNDFEKAFNYQQLLNETRESVYGSGNTQAIQTLLSQDQEQQKQLEIERITYQSQLNQYAFLGGLVVFLLISFILYRNNRKQKEANTILHQQKEEINTQRIELKQSLTDLRTTQTQLIQREKMASLGELTAGIAHEIQNPLNFVNNFSEVSVELVDELDQELERGDTQEARVIANDLRDNLQRITQNGQRASNIVKGMLEHSRTSSGEHQPTDLNALCDEYFRLAYQGARAKNSSFTCQLETHFETDLPLVSVVASDMSRVLLNLFNNAFYAVAQKQKTAPADYQPTVSVSTTQLNGCVEIRVRDNGSGIPPSIQAKIFQPFFTTKPTGEGTGLGLSLSYDIVTKGHGGTLTVESETGEGTEFIVTLPLIDA